MPTPVIMPALGMAQETGKLLRWHKAEGDTVVKGEPLFEVGTDKVTVDVDAPADGTLAGVRVGEGAEVPVGEAVGVLLAAGEVLAPESEPRLVREVEAEVAASAPVAAARVAVDEPDGDGRSRRRLASPKARRLAEAHGVDIESLSGSGPNGAVVAADVEARAAGGGEADAIEVGSVWRLMAERTTRSWQTVPHFVLRREVEATRLNSWRAAARAKPGG